MKNVFRFPTAAAATILYFVLGIGAATSIAQSPFIDGRPSIDQQRAERTARRDQAQKLFDGWRANAGKHEDLEQISSLGGLRPSRENTIAVIQSLRDQDLSPDDKAVIMRLSGKLFRDLDEQGDISSKEMLRTYIANVAKSENEPKLWKSAAYTYSRMGWFPDSLRVFARGRLIWGDREYHGELAHAVVSASKGDQLLIIREIANGDTRFGGGWNDFGKEILANQLRNPANVRMLSPDAVRAALAMFKKKEPAFPVEPDKMGVGSLAASNEWVGAVVTLTAQETGEPPRIILPRLVNVDDDPRKLIALLMESQTAALLRSSMDQKSLARIATNINAFAEKHKANANVQNFVSMARVRLAE